MRSKPKSEEPPGDDRELIDHLGRLALEGKATPQVSAADVIGAQKADDEAAEKSAEDYSDKPAEERGNKPAEERNDRLASHSIRVNVDTLDHLMTTVSELVLTRNQLLEIVRRQDDSDFKVPLQRLSNVTAELQEGVMKTRMQPIGNAWQKLPRVVRDLCAELGKDIELRDAWRRHRAGPSGA